MLHGLLFTLYVVFFILLFLAFQTFTLYSLKKQIPKFGGKPYIYLLCKEIA